MELTTTILGQVRELARSPGVGPETALFTGGVLDSMALAELVAFLEDTFAIRFGPMDVSPDNLDTVERISAYVARKRGV